MLLRGSDCYLRAREAPPADRRSCAQLRSDGVASIGGPRRELRRQRRHDPPRPAAARPAGVLTRVHGGADLSGRDRAGRRPGAALRARSPRSHAADKDAVAAAARQQTGRATATCVLLDIGTTTLMLARRAARAPGHRDHHQPGRPRRAARRHRRSSWCCSAGCVRAQLPLPGRRPHRGRPAPGPRRPRLPRRERRRAPTGRSWTPPLVEVPVKRALIAAADQVGAAGRPAQVPRHGRRCGSAASRLDVRRHQRPGRPGTRSTALRRGRRGGAAIV